MPHSDTDTPFTSEEREFARRCDLLAYYRAPKTIAREASYQICGKYNADYFLQLLVPAHRKIKPLSRPGLYPIPNGLVGSNSSFSELVLHIFFHCVSLSEAEEGGDNPNPNVAEALPPPTSWPTIFPDYPTLKAHQEALLQGPLLKKHSQYLRETNNPGITSLFTIPFLELLKTRRSDPLVILAVHMQVLFFVRCVVPVPIHWMKNSGAKLCKDQMDEFLGCREMEEWFQGQPETVRAECMKTVEDLGLETSKGVWVRNAIAEWKRTEEFLNRDLELPRELYDTISHLKLRSTRIVPV
ncbi:hypothetical protein PQX77_005909 [Marasmius sp. AFHP31]|nr:hypothetical protein PQX77_005909 [Marasmius sp. AFHP31]